MTIQGIFHNIYSLLEQPLNSSLQGPCCVNMRIMGLGACAIGVIALCLLYKNAQLQHRVKRLEVDLNDSNAVLGVVNGAQPVFDRR